MGHLRGVVVLSVGSLFSGIGGFDLGLERAGGFRTAWFCEQDEFCQHVLAQHWPGVPIFDDICRIGCGDGGAKAGAGRPSPDIVVPRVDVLCGGFPCQDLSYAGQGAGLAGARSGLWSEYARLIGELRPRYVVVENVSALLARGLGVVLGDLAALGYDAEWDCIPASAVGAPHRRDRIWLVAYPNGEGEPGGAGDAQPGCGLVVQGRGAHRAAALADAAGLECQAVPAGVSSRRSHSWEVEPDVGRVADGVPARVDRLRSLGNALVPQIAEWIGHRIVEWEGSVTA